MLCEAQAPQCHSVFPKTNPSPDPGRRVYVNGDGPHWVSLYSKTAPVFYFVLFLLGFGSFVFFLFSLVLHESRLAVLTESASHPLMCDLSGPGCLTWYDQCRIFSFLKESKRPPVLTFIGRIHQGVLRRSSRSILRSARNAGVYSRRRSCLSTPKTKAGTATGVGHPTTDGLH